MASRRDAPAGSGQLATLEELVAAAIRDSEGDVREEGSGWDKLIIPLP